jgi:hypothetical protein
MPSRQFVEEPAPVSESLWASFVGERQLVTERDSLERSC